MILLVAEIARLATILAGVAGGILVATNSALVVVSRNEDWDETGAVVTGILVVPLAADGEAVAGCTGAANERLTPAPTKPFVFVGEYFVSES